MGKEFLCDIPSMEYTTDHLGQELLLQDGNLQVMMEWEKEYMHACIDALRPQGDVLEVGFGCGYSATHIQTYAPKSHTIIEYHPVVAERARAWAQNYSQVTIVEDTWQNALSSLGVYDSIFFDDYPLQSQKEQEQIDKSSQESLGLLREGQQLLAHVEEKLPFLTSLKYSKEELQALCDATEGESRAFFRFLTELKSRGQITNTLFEEMKQHCASKISPEEMRILEAPHLPAQPPKDRLMQFLSQCLAHHMRPSSRFSCFLSDPTTPWENRAFCQEIIANPYLDFRYFEIPVDAPAHCTYYQAKTALVITVEKLYHQHRSGTVETSSCEF